MPEDEESTVSFVFLLVLTLFLFRGFPVPVLRVSTAVPAAAFLFYLNPLIDRATIYDGLCIFVGTEND